MLASDRRKKPFDMFHSGLELQLFVTFVIVLISRVLLIPPRPPLWYCSSLNPRPPRRRPHNPFYLSH